MLLRVANLRLVSSVAAMGTTVFGCAAFAMASEELAVDSPSVAAARAQNVVLLELADGTSSLDFVPNLRGQLAELNLSLNEVPVPTPSSLLDTVQESEKIAAATGALLVAWVARTGTRADIFLFDPKGPHLYAQEVSVSDSPSAASEELAIVLRSAISARVDGNTLGMAEIALPPKPQPGPVGSRKLADAVTMPAMPAPVLSMKPRWGLGLSGASERPVTHAPLQVGLALRAWMIVRSVRVGLGYTIFPDLKVATVPADFNLSRHPFELFAGYAIKASSVVVIAETALGSDVTRRETIRAAAPLWQLGLERRWLWTASERLRFETQLASPVWLSLAAGAEVPLNPYSFEVAPAGQHQSVARVLPVRPRFDLGLTCIWP